MKILYLGNFEAPWCTEVDVTRDLESLGVEVLRVQEPNPKSGRKFLLDLERQADGCAALFFQRTWGLHRSATDLWRRLEANGTKTASYHLDLYVGLARQDAVPRDPFWTTGYVFTPDGNSEAAAWFAEHGIAHHYMPPAIGSHQCFPGTYDPDLAQDVVFVGSRGYHHEWPHRVELIDWLAETYGDRFRLYNGDTGYTRRGVRHEGQIRCGHLNDLYASAKVVVGDSCFASRGQRYWSDRPMETWGRGGYLVFPMIDALEAQVGPYPSWEPGDWTTLQTRIDDALGDAYHRDHTAARLHETVKSGHTYQHRLSEALRIMELA